MIKPTVIESNGNEKMSEMLKAAVGIAKVVQLTAEEMGVISGGLNVGHPTGKTSAVPQI
ncbi:MAG: hypothetical protein JO142_14685 [Burkholderiales bacterium]|nr:hypothetical protein [Burkholderiales bacterium]